MNSWKTEVVELLKNLGGHAYLKDIYEEFLESHTRDVTENYQSSIRDTLEKGSRESSKYDGIPLFYMVDGKNKGHYGLINYIPEQPDYTQEDDEFTEGKVNLVQHLRRERNQYLITTAKKLFKEKHGKLYCEICGFDFKQHYGDLGDGFIEAHHVKPVSQMQENEKTKIDDIIMVCSNYHSMLHRRKPWITKNELKEILNQSH